MKSYYSENEMLSAVRIAIKTAGSQKAFAQRAGVSEQYLSDALKGRRSVSDRILNSLGMKRIVLYAKGNKNK